LLVNEENSCRNFVRNFGDHSNFNENFIDTYVEKALYFTATPKNSNGIKMYEPITDITIDDEDCEQYYNKTYGGNK
jgi:hypothetical protein